MHVVAVRTAGMAIASGTCASVTVLVRIFPFSCFDFLLFFFQDKGKI